MKTRKYFVEELSKILEKDNGEGVFYLVAIDVAEFKQINYQYGFDVGDQFLHDLAQFIKKIPSCVFCERAIDDRFFLMMRGHREQTEEELQTRYNHWWNMFWVSKQPDFPVCNLKMWCGIYRLVGKNVQLALDNADMARQKAKEIKADTAVFFESSMVEEVKAKKKQEYEVMQALRAGRFSYFLQPQVDIRTGKIIGAEALARGFTESGEMISPAVFIPMLEKNGAVVKLDFMILEQVCKTIRNRLDRHEPVLRISVNLSRLHLKNPRAAEQMHAIITSFGIPTEYIMFELTESVILDSFAAAQHTGTALNRMGYKTSIDDFGSGFAGIDTCRRLSFDELKLDKSFLDAAPEYATRNTIIMEGIVSIMNKLGVSVICEGVEKPEQCRDLLEIGCKLVQGFYFSEPMAPEEFYSTYEKQNGHYPLTYMQECREA